MARSALAVLLVIARARMAAGAAADCSTYCSTFLSTCTSSLNLGMTNSSCMTWCQASYLTAEELGKDNDTSGDTIGCRLYHAGVASTLNGTGKKTHCGHAAPEGGGVCGSWCQVYCGPQMKNTMCGRMFEYPPAGAGFVSAACTETCKTYGVSTDYTGAAVTTYPVASNNSVQCRLYHLHAASASGDDLHCAHAWASGGGVCGSAAESWFNLINTSRCSSTIGSMMATQTKMGFELKSDLLINKAYGIAYTSSETADVYPMNYGNMSLQEKSALATQRGNTSYFMDTQACRIYHLTAGLISDGFAGHCFHGTLESPADENGTAGGICGPAMATATTAAPTTSVGSATTAAPTTSVGSATTAAPTTSVGSATTAAPTTSVGSATTAAPTTSVGSATTAAPTTSVGSATTAAPTTSVGAATTAAPTTSVGSATTAAPGSTGPAPAPAPTVTGSFKTTVGDCAASSQDANVKKSVEEAIAAVASNSTTVNVGADSVAATLTCPSRRLEAAAMEVPSLRRLTDSMNVDYTITLPQGSTGQDVVDNIKSTPKDVLTVTLSQKLTDNGVTGTTISVTEIAEPQVATPAPSPAPPTNDSVASEAGNIRALSLMVAMVGVVALLLQPTV